MDEVNLARLISEKVVSGTQFWVALIGIIGAALTLTGNIIFHWLKGRPQRDLESQRTAILKTMLDDDRFSEKWRELSTLPAVIGANDEEKNDY